jgi:ABC-type antimicrobial peptide transport system permease subunit
MRFLDYLPLSTKNLTRQKARTVLTIIAITVGSMSLILMVSLIVSIRRSVINSFQKLGAFQLVTLVRDPNPPTDNAQIITNGNNNPDEEEGKKIDDITLATVRKIPHVIDATAIGPGIWMKTARLDGQTKKIWPNVLSYTPETKVFEMPLLAGRNLTNTDMDKVVVGTGILETYGYVGRPKDIIGKKLIFTYDSGPGSGPDWGDPPKAPPQNADKTWYEDKKNQGMEIAVEIVGVADNQNMDSNQNYINLAWAKKLMTVVHWEWDETERKACQERMNRLMSQYDKETGENPPTANENCDNYGKNQLVKEDNFTKSGYGSIIMKVDDTDNIELVAKEIQNLGYGATTAKNMVDQINKITLLIGVVLGLIGGISLFVAAIGIINTMIMATYERTREIGVLRACGATRATIRWLFTLEAALLGFWGGVFGLGVSILLGLLARLLVAKFGAALGSIPLNEIGSFPLWLIAGVIGFTTVMGTAAGLIPAIRASRLNPVEALRYE